MFLDNQRHNYRCIQYKMILFLIGVVHTAMWAQNGRWFQRAATWRDAGGLTVSSALYPNKEFGLNGRHLTIGTNIVSFRQYVISTNDVTYDNQFNMFFSSSKFTRKRKTRTNHNK